MDTEQYIEHEVQLRLHDKKFDLIERDLDEMKQSFRSLDSKIDNAIKHLDNKLMWILGLVLGSIWLPGILHYLHLT